MTPEQLRKVHALRDDVLRTIDNRHLTTAEAISGLTNALGWLIARAHRTHPEAITSVLTHLPQYVEGYRKQIEPPEEVK